MRRDRVAPALGLWVAPWSADLTRLDVWTEQIPAPDIAPADSEALFRVIDAGVIRASMVDSASAVVLGAFACPHQQLAFGAECDQGTVRIWATRTRVLADLHPLLRHWADLVPRYERRHQGANMQRFLADLSQFDRDGLRTEPISVPDLPLQATFDRIAFREPNQAKRLLVCCRLVTDTLAQRDRKDTRPVVMVDNLCTIAGDLINIAGLRPTHRFVGVGWQVMDPSAKGAPAQALEQFCTQVEARRAQFSQASRRTRGSVISDEASLAPHAGGTVAPRMPTQLADLHELKSLPSHDSIAVFCRAVGNELMEGPNRYPTPYLDALESTVFEYPTELGLERLAHAAPDWMSRGSLAPMVRGVIIARNPKLVLRDGRGFINWVRSLRDLQLHERTACVAVATQAAYDACHLVAGDAATSRPLKLLRMLVSDAVQRAEVTAFEAAKRSPGSLWSQLSHQVGLVEAFDRLAELQIGSDQRHQLRAQALIRLAVGMPTPDVIDRAVRFALVESRSEIDALVTRGLCSQALVDLALVAIADQETCEMAQARDVLRARFPPADAADDAGRQSVFRSFA